MWHDQIWLDYGEQIEGGGMNECSGKQCYAFALVWMRHNDNESGQIRDGERWNIPKIFGR